MMLRNYRYRLYPSQKQQGRLFQVFDLCCEMWNHLLDVSTWSYQATGKNFSSRKTLYSLVKATKDNVLRFQDVHSQLLQNGADRLSKAYQGFFRKLARFPRFKRRVRSITFPDADQVTGYKLVSNERLRLSGVGRVRIVMHRPLGGRAKTCTIKRTKEGRWWAIFSCEVEARPEAHQQAEERIGIDVGLTSFVALSTGEKLEHPRYLVRAEKRLKKLQRRVSRKKRGSMNRRKAAQRVARAHARIAHQRMDFLHKLSFQLTQHYGFIAVEALNIQGMVKNHRLAKHISDASWGRFIQMLAYKAVTAGGQLILVAARDTSQLCSRCGNKATLGLEQRTFACACCGLSLDRDVNAAQNILARATAGPAGSYACGDKASTLPLQEGGASPVAEAGTIYGNVS